LSPAQLDVPGSLRVTIQNTGNSVGEFGVVAREPTEEIRFRGERGRIGLQPGQSATLELQAEARRRVWFGAPRLVQFEIEVVARGGGRRGLTGEGRIVPLLPPGLLYGALFLLVFLCVLAALFVVFERGRDPFGVLAGGTATADLAAEGATATVGAATATAAAATAVAATAAVAGDLDRDGLSDAQERVVATAPDNPDSDADLLLDGEEVLTWGTNPLNRDTDGDLILDGDEVKVYRTNPVRRDSDGDGIADGAEIAAGTDPLNALSPFPTATPTMTFIAPPTATAPSPTTGPTATGTVAPPPTATWTPLPTSTATVAPPATATPTPSATNSAVPPTPTATLAGAPSLTCATVLPELDGEILPAEWGSLPMIQFSPEGDPSREVLEFAMRSDEFLYLGFVINDPTLHQATDSLKIYLDANNSGGDPDSTDRFLQVTRDGTVTVRAGLGTSSDGQEWGNAYVSPAWAVVVDELPADAWAIEAAIDLTEELNPLANGGNYRQMLLVLYGGSQAPWPTEGVTNDADTWQSIANLPC
jgi:hypothetical protein